MKQKQVQNISCSGLGMCQSQRERRVGARICASDDETEHGVLLYYACRGGAVGSRVGLIILRS